MEGQVRGLRFVRLGIRREEKDKAALVEEGGDLASQASPSPFESFWPGASRAFQL